MKFYVETYYALTKRPLGTYVKLYLLDNDFINKNKTKNRYILTNRQKSPTSVTAKIKTLK